MSFGALMFILMLAALFILALVFVAIRWSSRADIRYPHEQGDTEDFR